MHYGIGVGSKTSTGGEVIEGNSSVILDGFIASSLGQMATCKVCQQGMGPIVGVGPREILLPAGLAARSGDYVACGCPPGANVLLPAGTVHMGTYGGGAGAPAMAMRSAAFTTPAESVPAGNSAVSNAELAEALKGAMWPPYNPMTGEDLTDKLRAALEANHKKAIILTLADAAATLKDMAEELGDRAANFSWEKDGTKTLEAASTAHDWGGYGAAVYKAYDLAKQFGDYGVKAEVFTSKGKEYIAITTKNNSGKVLRHVLVNGVRVKLNGHKYRANNYKVVQLGLTPQSRMSGYKGAGVVTFIISATINTNELVFNDDYHLVDWFGNVGTDMFKGMVAIGAGEALLLGLGVSGAGAIILGAIVVVGISILIENIFDDWKVSEKVVSGLKNATE